MKRRIAINGFGRIGRLATRLLLQEKHLELVAINDLSPAPTLAHLFKYDSAYGQWPHRIEAFENEIQLGKGLVKTFSMQDPAQLPWRALKIDIVLECTGKFTSRAGAQKHLDAGAKRVIISAPAKEDDLPTIVLGVNDEILQHPHPIVSNASCTTNCLAPMVKVLDKTFGVVSGLMNTIHAYTADQSLQDGSHTDLRRARAAAVSIIPTTTGAAKAIGLVMPHLKGRLDGMATRVPVLNGSLTDFTALLKHPATVEEINAAMYKASRGFLRGILEYTDEPIVSADVRDNLHSCIFDAALTKAQGNLVKVVGWYDNEAAYSARLVAVAKKLLFPPIEFQNK